jgi:hypothetical protein
MDRHGPEEPDSKSVPANHKPHHPFPVQTRKRKAESSLILPAGFKSDEKALDSSEAGNGESRIHNYSLLAPPSSDTFFRSYAKG